MKDYWNYTVIKEFSKEIYKECLRPEHLLKDGAEFTYMNLFILDRENKPIMKSLPVQNRLCVQMRKGNEFYIVPAHFTTKFPFKVMNSERCIIKERDSQVWKYVTQVDQPTIPPKAFGTFKQFIENWNPVDHTNQTTRKFYALCAIAAYYKRLNLCLCAEPASMKNADFTIIGHLKGDVCRVAKPTLAKLEHSYYYNRILLPDEMTSLNQSGVEDVEPTFLLVGDGTPELNAHSMKKDDRQNKMDMTHKSTVFTYNRVQDLGAGSKFFDDIWKSKMAFKSRYPQLLLDGHITERGRNLSSAQAREIMVAHMTDLKKILCEFEYWTTTMHEKKHGWNTELLTGQVERHLTGRHYTNVESLLDTIDVYCESQAEFDEWMLFILNALTAYKQMTAELPQDEPKIETVVPKSVSDSLKKVDEEIL